MRTLREAFLIHGSLFVEFDYEEAEKLTGIDASLIRERITTFRELHIPPNVLISIMKEQGTKLSLL